MLHVISLAQYATAYTRGWAADSTNGRVRSKAESDRTQQEILHLLEEMRIKDARMAQISPHRRPCYSPTERMARFLSSVRPVAGHDSRRRTLSQTSR